MFLLHDCQRRWLAREEFGASSFHFRSTAFRFKLNPTPISIYSDCRAVTIGPSAAATAWARRLRLFAVGQATKLLRDRHLRTATQAG